MKRIEIKRMMVVHNDPDFTKMWDWIGETVLNTFVYDENTSGDKVLEDSEDIEKFILSLVQTGLEFIQYRVGKYNKSFRYMDISKEDTKQLCEHFNSVKFKYNFEFDDEDWLYGGSESLVIDVENNDTYTI